MITANDLKDRAQALTSRILAKGTAAVAPTPVAAWAAVCRACAAADHVFRQECRRRANAEVYAMTRAELTWRDNLDRLWGPAKAQVAHLTRHLEAA